MMKPHDSSRSRCLARYVCMYICVYRSQHMIMNNTFHATWLLPNSTHAKARTLLKLLIWDSLCFHSQHSVDSELRSLLWWASLCQQSALPHSMFFILDSHTRLTDYYLLSLASDIRRRIASRYQPADTSQNTDLPVWAYIINLPVK